MSDCRDYREILQGDSLDSSDSSSDWSQTLGSQDTWSESTDDSRQEEDSFIVSSENSQN